MEQMQRLLLALDLDPKFAGIAGDWIDDNRDAQYPDGAEDSIYTGMTPPYRAANQLLSSVTTGRQVLLRHLDIIKDKITGRFTAD